MITLFAQKIYRIFWRSCREK